MDEALEALPYWFILGSVQPSPDDIRLQLDRILASEPLANSDRLRRFLRYVVERTLAGEGDRLKEFVIGSEVFDRNDQYDPRLDSIVRVEAGRLRAKLDEYYVGPGACDSVIIRLPRGGYAPAFELRQPVSAPPVSPGPSGDRSASTLTRRTLLAACLGVALLLLGIAVGRSSRSTPAAAPPSGTTIAVLPFASYSTDESARLLAARVTNGVTGDLARIGTLGVVSHTSAVRFAGARRSLRDVAEELHADVILEGSLVVEGNRVRVDARLVDAATDRKFWVEEFAADVADVRRLEQRLASAAASAIAQRAPSPMPAEGRGVLPER